MFKLALAATAALCLLSACATPPQDGEAKPFRSEISPTPLADRPTAPSATPSPANIMR